MSTMQVAVQLKVAQTGLENIQALIAELKKAGQDTSAFEARAQELGTTLQQLGQKTQAIESFKALKQATSDSARSLDAAQQKAQALGKAYAALESPTKKQTAEFERARKAVRDAADAHQQNVLALQGQRKAMADVGVSTANLSVQLSSIKAATSNARNALAALEETAKSARGGINDLPPSLDRAASSAKSAGEAFSSIKQGIGAGLGFAAAQAGLNTLGGALDKLRQGIVDIVKTGATFETLRTQLQTLYGSAAQAEQAFEWVNRFTAETPFELEQVTQGFIKLKAMGLDPMDGSFQAIADQAAALGASGETLNGIILALGQAWSKQKLQGEEALQLIERGVPVWELLAKATGKTAAELQELSAKGQLGRDAIKALMDEMGKANTGAATAAMKTFNGQLSNLQDNWTEFQRRIADSGAFDFFKSQLETVNQAIARMKADGRLDVYAKQVSDAIVFMGEAIKSGVVFVQNYADTLVLLGTVAAGLKLTHAAQQLTLFATNALLAQDAAESASKRITQAFAVLNAAVVGWQLGSHLKTQFIEVELAGIALAEGLTKMAARFKYALDILNTPVGLDTFDLIAERTRRLDEELASISKEYAELADAAQAARQPQQDVAKAMQDTASGAREAAAGAAEFGGAARKAAGDAAGLAKTVGDDLASAFKTLKIDPREVTTGLKEVEVAVIQAFDTIRTNPAVDGEVIFASFKAALNEVPARLIPALVASLRQAGDEGQISGKMLAEGMELAKTRMQELSGAVQRINLGGLADQADALAGKIEGANPSMAALLRNVKNLDEGVQQTAQTFDGAGKTISVFDEILQGVANADSPGKLKKATDSLNRSFSDGKISSEEFTKGLEAADNQSRLLTVTVKQAAAYLDGMTDAMRKQANAIWLNNTATAEINRQMGTLLQGQINIAQGGNETVAQLEAQNVTLRAQAKAAEEAANQWRAIGAATAALGASDYYGAIAAQSKLAQVMAEQAIAANEAKIAQEQLRDAMRSLNDEAAGGNLTLEQQRDRLLVLQEQFQRLDDASLSALRSEIDAVNGKLQAMQEQAQATLDSLRQEQARQRGDDATAVQIENARKRAELEKRIDEARKAGNDEAVRTLQEALQIQQELASEAEREARARQSAARAEQAANSTQRTQTQRTENSSTLTVKVQADGAGLGSLDRAALDSLARQLAPILKQQSSRGLS